MGPSDCCVHVSPLAWEALPGLAAAHLSCQPRPLSPFPIVAVGWSVHLAPAPAPRHPRAEVSSDLEGTLPLCREGSQASQGRWTGDPRSTAALCGTHAEFPPHVRGHRSPVPKRRILWCWELGVVGFADKIRLRFGKQSLVAVSGTLSCVCGVSFSGWSTEADVPPVPVACSVDGGFVQGPWLLWSKAREHLLRPLTEFKTASQVGTCYSQSHLETADRPRGAWGHGV